MTKHKVAELAGSDLNTAVMQAHAVKYGLQIYVANGGRLFFGDGTGYEDIDPETFKPLEVGCLAAQIMGREHIYSVMLADGREAAFVDDGVQRTRAEMREHAKSNGQFGTDYFVAPMRAFCAHVFGTEVEL